MPNYNTALFSNTISNHNGANVIALISRITTIKSEKIGTMLSTYILPKDVEPTVATKTGFDDTCCGNCPKRPSVAKNDPTQPVCYVRTWQGAGKTWSSYTKGNVLDFGEIHQQFVKGRGLRMGSYGDPTMIPLSEWKPLLDIAPYHTGYTSMWREDYAQEYKGLLQASCTSKTEQEEAVEKGWTGTYTTYPTSVNLDDMPGVTCPNLRNKEITCSDCKLCNGKNHIKTHDHGLPYKVRK